MHWMIIGIGKGGAGRWGGRCPHVLGKQYEMRLLTLMDVLPYSNKQESGPLDNAVIEIVGDNGFNNDILADYICEQSGARCFCVQDCTLQGAAEQSYSGIRLIFFDCTDMNWSTIEHWIAPRVRMNDAGTMAVCFNMNSNIQIEQEAIRLGVRGVIDRGTPMDIYPKVVHAILNGELWFTRKALQCFLEAPAPRQDGIHAEAELILTRREQTILNMIAMGNSNKEIAKGLCISPHTVKTHIYNLYRKIKVTNRFQATLWLKSKSSRPSR